jgi:hypothetical protein
VVIMDAQIPPTFGTTPTTVSPSIGIAKEPVRFPPDAIDKLNAYFAQQRYATGMQLTDLETSTGLTRQQISQWLVSKRSLDSFAI